MSIDDNYLLWLKRVATLEAISTILLFFVAMPMKYWADMPLAVTIVGSIHGVLFTMVVVMYNNAIKRVPISVGLAVAGVTGAVIPFGPFIVNRLIDKAVRQV